MNDSTQQNPLTGERITPEWVDIEAEKTSDRMMEIVNKHFNKKEPTMNNLEKTIYDSIKHFVKQYAKEGVEFKTYVDGKWDKADYIVDNILDNDLEFKDALYQIVTEKLEGRS
jgi:hypothetical protein